HKLPRQGEIASLTSATHHTERIVRQGDVHYALCGTPRSGGSLSLWGLLSPALPSHAPLQWHAVDVIDPFAWRGPDPRADRLLALNSAGWRDIQMRSTTDVRRDLGVTESLWTVLFRD